MLPFGYCNTRHCLHVEMLLTSQSHTSLDNVVCKFQHCLDISTLELPLWLIELVCFYCLLIMY